VQGRIRHPVSIVPRVQLPLRPVEGEIEARVATSAEGDLGCPGLVHRAVTEQRHVGLQSRSQLGNTPPQVRAAVLFFALEQKHEADTSLPVWLVQGVEGGGYGGQRGLVI